MNKGAQGPTTDSAERLQIGGPPIEPRQDEALAGVQVLTYRQVARALQVSEVTVRRLASRGLIRTIKIGSSVRVHPDAVEEFIRRHERSATKGATRT